MSWGASSSAGRWSSSGGAENDRNKKAGHRGFNSEEGDIVVASDSKSKLWRDISLKQTKKIET